MRLCGASNLDTFGADCSIIYTKRSYLGVVTFSYGHKTVCEACMLLAELSSGLVVM